MQLHRLVRGAAIGVMATCVAAAPGAEPGTRPDGTLSAETQAARTVTGRVLAVSRAGFDLKRASREGAPADQTPTPVTVSRSTRTYSAKTGYLVDLKIDTLIAIRGEKQADGRLAAREIVRLWPATGDPSPADQQLAAAIARGARRLVAPAKQRAGGSHSAGHGAKQGTAPSPSVAVSEARARKDAVPLIIGRITTAYPLEIVRGSERIAVSTAAVSHVTWLTAGEVKDLRAGDQVAVVPRAMPSSSEESSPLAADAVVRAAARQGRRRKAARTAHTARNPTRTPRGAGATGSR